tara:strand:- start:70 stop:1122 length:1053 start_codon:yes stop_codon:yes gene_type:complete
MGKPINIADCRIGFGHPCFIIAEAGVNHNGNLEMAHRLVDVAVHAEADAVKFQTFKAQEVISVQAPKAAYQLQTTDGAESQLEMAQRLELPYHAFRELHEGCLQKGISFLSTPFDVESTDFLDEMGVEAFKVPSGEITNLPFLDHIARKHKLVILSTGMSSLEEVESAIRVIDRAGNRDVILLHCTSSYPADPAESNLRAMETMRNAFGLPIGYSDHTPGIEVSLAAVALGACVIEKHVTLDHSLPGPDHRASIDPSELQALVRGVRCVESSLGDGIKRPARGELDTMAVARRSLVAKRSLQSGTVLNIGDIAIKRPGTGIAPSELQCVMGRTLVRSLERDQLLKWEDLE